jgi:hypothetical protein
MPVVVPLIVAAAPVVARYIASKGIAMAIKKFTKQSITAAKQIIKNEKRALKKPNEGQKTNYEIGRHTQTSGRMKNRGRKEAAVVGGVLYGADKIANRKKTAKVGPPTKGTSENPSSPVNKGMSPFEKAFAAARVKKVKTFSYKGDVYNTKLKTKVKPTKK